MTFLGIFFIGIVLTVAIVCIGYGLGGYRLFDQSNRKALDKYVTKEQGDILKAHLKPSGSASYSNLLLLFFSGLNIYGIAVFPGFGGSPSMLTLYTFISTVFHTLFFAIILAFVMWMVSEGRKSPRFSLPVLRGFMEDKEAHFLFWVAGKEDEYESEFLSKTAVFPENLVPIFKNWDSVQKFASTYDRLRKSLRGKEEYLSPRQRAQQKELIAELREKTKEFAPFYQLLLDSVNKEAEKIKVIKEDIPVTLEQMAREIHSLESGRIVAEKDIDKEEDGTVLKELKRVADSDTVSADMRKEATELISFIETREQQEVVERKREMEHLNALSIIQASRIFYGIGEEEMERK